MESDGDTNEFWDLDDNEVDKANNIAESPWELQALFDAATILAPPSFPVGPRELLGAEGEGAGEEKGCKMLRQASSKSVDEPKRAASLVCIIFRDLNMNSNFNAFQNVAPNASAPLPQLERASV